VGKEYFNWFLQHPVWMTQF